MSDQHANHLTIPWCRYWTRLDEPVHLSDEGILSDPADWIGKHYNSHLLKTAHIPLQGCVVLTGDPGMGKSTELNNFSSQIKGQDFLIKKHCRSFPSPDNFSQKVFGCNEWLQWRTSQDRRMTLLLDGIDEGIKKISDFLLFLREELSTQPIKRLSLVLVCRSADWPFSQGQDLLELWGNTSRPSFFELCPLTYEDIRLAAKNRNVDDQSFLKAIFDQHVEPLAARPVTLFFLLEKFKQGGGLPNSYRELYLGAR
jgi:hypothetical protein